MDNVSKNLPLLMLVTKCWKSPSPSISKPAVVQTSSTPIRVVAPGCSAAWPHPSLYTSDRMLCSTSSALSESMDIAEIICTMMEYLHRDRALWKRYEEMGRIRSKVLLFINRFHGVYSSSKKGAATFSPIILTFYFYSVQETKKNKQTLRATIWQVNEHCIRGLVTQN